MSFNTKSTKKLGSMTLALALCASLAGFTGATASAFADDSDAPIAEASREEAPAPMNEGAADDSNKEDGNDAEKDDAPKAEPQTGGDNLLQSPDAEPMNEEGGGVVREEPARIDGESEADAEDAPKNGAPQSMDDAPAAEPQPAEPQPETPPLPDASDDE